jgi:MFS family permease
MTAVSKSETGPDAAMAHLEKHDMEKQHAHDHAFNTDDHELPKGYFHSPFFIGTMAALCFNLAAGVGGFALLAPILTQINADIGPSKNIVWVALIYTICLSIGLALVGRLSDLFGRRYFLIGGNVLGLVGCIVCCTAKTVPTLIGGETLVGLAASTGASYPFIMGELVPMKYRFATNAFVYLFQLPTSCFGPAMAYIFIINTKPGWRWCYYYLIIWNALALILFTVFYFPPTFHEKHGNDRIIKWIKRYDYIGTGLFIAGIVLFLMGLSWGGSVYPWKSAHVIATIVIGGIVLIAFGLYESLVPLQEPFIPVKLFKNGHWVATIFVISFCGGVYYAFALVWPGMVSTLYSHANNPMYTGYLSCVVAIGITTGEIIGCLVTEPIGKAKFQLIAAFSIGSIFLACKLLPTLCIRRTFN